MKILVVSQYFWPENFRINDLCLSLQRNGHEVTVLTAQPNYPDGEIFEEYLEKPEFFNNFNGIRVVRSPIFPRKKGAISLFFNYISFVFSGSFMAVTKLNNKFDVILVCQLSPITSVIPAILFKTFNKIPIVMWSLDLWPESLQSVGAVKSKKVLTLLGFLVSWIYKRCDVILGQSSSYLQAIQKRCSSSVDLQLFPNWAEEQFKIPRKPKIKKNPFNILFAGNIGDAQDFDSLIKCVELLKINKIEVIFTIVGSGSKYVWLQSMIEKYNLEKYFVLKGRHPLEDMPTFYSEADAGLVSLKPSDIFERTIPGKIQSYMLSSMPILGMLNGEGNRLINEAGCGLCASASDAYNLFENIKTMSSLSEEELKKLGERGLQYAENEFNKEVLIARLENILHNSTTSKNDK